MDSANRLSFDDANAAFHSMDLHPVRHLFYFYKEEELLGKKVIVVTNLVHSKIQEEKSEGMLLAAVSVDNT